jgi:hypothetical protein
MKSILPVFGALLLSGCGVFGAQTVEVAPYETLTKQDQFELRHYDSLVLVTTPMKSQDGSDGAFSSLFGYISGENEQDQKIAMTAPVFMDKGTSDQNMMSFVLPRDFSFENAPIPKNAAVELEEIEDYTVAVITFNGRLSEGNIDENKAMLNDWVTQQNYTVTGDAKTAGYNAPWTIPTFRRNEILIPVEKPE